MRGLEACAGASFASATARYARLGWCVIPLCPPTPAGACGCGRGHIGRAVGKAPLVKWEPYVVALPSAATQAAWARAWPHANAGALAEPSHLLVIDLDSAAAFAEAHALGLSPTAKVRTAHGEHWYYAAPAGRTGRAIRRGESRAIDVLASGYVVTPPSLHRAGVRYEWLSPFEAAPLAPAPAWAVAMLEETTRAAVTTPAVLGDVGAPLPLDALRVPPRVRELIRDGTSPRYPSRSEALFAVLQALVRGGYDDATMAAVVLDLAHGISAKPRECGRRWLAHEIARARAKCPVLVIA